MMGRHHSGSPGRQDSLVRLPDVTVLVFDTETRHVSMGKPPLVRGLGWQEGGKRAERDVPLPEKKTD